MEINSKKTKKMGRPPKGKDKKAKQVKVSFDEKDLSRLKDLSMNVPLGKFLREHIESSLLNSNAITLYFNDTSMERLLELSKNEDTATFLLNALESKVINPDPEP